MTNPTMFQWSWRPRNPGSVLIGTFPHPSKPRHKPVHDVVIVVAAIVVSIAFVVPFVVTFVVGRGCRVVVGGRSRPSALPKVVVWPDVAATCRLEPSLSSSCRLEPTLTTTSSTSLLVARRTVVERTRRCCDPNLLCARMSHRNKSQLG